MWRRSGGERKGSYRGKNTTEDEAETMDVSIVVGVVLHCRGRGRVRDVVRLEGKHWELADERGGMARMIGSMRDRE